MACPKRSKFERERDLSIIADLYRRARSQQSIANHLNQLYYSERPITQQQIGYDIRILVSRWQKNAEQAINERQAIELARIDLLEREYWDAWDRSQRNAETVIIKRKKPNGGITDSPDDALLPDLEYDESGYPIEGPDEEREFRITGQVGDSRYLAGVQWCISKRCEILGLNAAIKSELSGPRGGPIQQRNEFANLSTEELYAVVANILVARGDGTPGSGADGRAPAKDDSDEPEPNEPDEETDLA